VSLDEGGGICGLFYVLLLSSLSRDPGAGVSAAQVLKSSCRQESTRVPDLLGSYVVLWRPPLLLVMTLLTHLFLEEPGAGVELVSLLSASHFCQDSL
jgi:hypothetical protein